jgi:hypothetical protein
MGKREEIFPVHHKGNGSEDSKWWPPALSLTLLELEEYAWTILYWIWVAKMGATQITSTIAVNWDFFLLDMSFILSVTPPIQVASGLVNISRRKPCNVNSPFLVS